MEALHDCIEMNRKLQEVQRQQISAVDAALINNAALQASVRAKVNLAAKSRRTEGPSALPSTRPKRMPGRQFFVDRKGSHPPRNPDADLRHVRFKEKMPLIYTTKQWKAADRLNLVKSARSVMQKMVMEQTMEFHCDADDVTPEQACTCCGAIPLIVH